MAQKKKILVVDDDPHIRDVVTFALVQAGFQVVEAEDGEDSLRKFKIEAPDLLVLDVMMPELQGTEVCKAIRKTSRTPIIFLTSAAEETDRIIGLEIGGDDYMAKPFSPKELVARVKAVLRRTEPIPVVDGGEVRAAKRHGELKLDPNTYQVFWAETEIVLTATEFSIMETLLRYPGKVYSRSELMDFAYEPNLVVTDRTIDSHVRRIRRKFRDAGADPIETVHGIGYKLTAKV